MTQKRYALISFVAGAILPFSFAPFRWFWLAPFPPAILLICWSNSATLKAVLWQGFLFGLGYFSIGASWVYIPIHKFGNANLALSGFITAAFISILSSYYMLQGSIFYGLGHDSQRKRLIIFPSIWVVSEWLRGWLFSGFPWLYLGFSQTPPSPLAGYAPIIGVYGLSFIIAFIAALLYNLFNHNKRIVYASLVALVVIPIIGAILYPIGWTTQIDHPFNVSLVQASIPDKVKWEPDQIISTLNTYQHLTQSHWNTLVIWPEGAIPIPSDEAKPYLNFLQLSAIDHHATLITGIPVKAPYPPNSYYNSILTLGQGHGLYMKRHLVPFGDYMPKYFKMPAKWFKMPESSFIPGPGNQPLLVADHMTIAPFICYEIAYANLLIDALPKAELLINLSDDGWFGHSFAAAQQLQIAQMRALQSGRYLLTVTNNEITAIIDPKGNIKHQLPTFSRGVLRDKIYPMRGATPWAALAKWL